MDLKKITDFIVIALWISLPLSATYYSYQATQRCEAYRQLLDKVVGKVVETHNEFIDRNSVFKATGYSVIPTEDDKVLITFAQDIGSKDKAIIRQVELPAQMWSSAVMREAAKMHVQSLKKGKKNENHK